MEIKILKKLVGEYTIPHVFRYQLCQPGTGFAIYYDNAKYIITAKHLEAPPRKEPAWINGPRDQIEVKALRLPITYDAVAHQLVDVPYNELIEAQVFPHASDVKKGDQVIYFGFPGEEEFKMVQSNELRTREAEIFAIDDYGYYRKFHISPGPESGYSGSPLFRKEKNGLVLIGIVAGKVVQQNPDGTTKDLQIGYAYSVDKVLKEIEASVDLAKEISKRAAEPKSDGIQGSRNL
jgi:Trypsin-like peptidase domain